jgi:hypothetical protein
MDAGHFVRSSHIVQFQGRVTLITEDPGGEALSSLIGNPMQLMHALLIGAELAATLDALHRQEFIHRNVQAAYIIIEKDFSRSIVHDHEGSVWAEPNATSGATFQFRIPARPSH